MGLGAAVERRPFHNTHPWKDDLYSEPETEAVLCPSTGAKSFHRLKPSGSISMCRQPPGKTFCQVAGWDQL